MVDTTAGGAIFDDYRQVISLRRGYGRTWNQERSEAARVSQT
jgi:hypothetical protein